MQKEKIAPCHWVYCGAKVIKSIEPKMDYGMKLLLWVIVLCGIHNLKTEVSNWQPPESYLSET